MVVLLLFCLLGPSLIAGNVLVAQLNSGGLQGSVEMLDNLQGTTIRVRLRGGAYGEKLRWKIHEFPPAHDSPAHPCTDDSVGRPFLDLGERLGLLEPGRDATLLLPQLNLVANASILGRALVLRSPARIACAPLQPTTRVRTRAANMAPPLSGFLAVQHSAVGSALRAHMWYNNGTRKDSLHRWSVVQGSCAGIPLWGIGQVAVGRQPNVVTGRTYHTQPPSAPSLDGQEDLFAVIYSDYDPSLILSCARLTVLEPRQALASFHAEASGELSFRQESPFDPTLVTVNVGSLRNRAYSYGIDELPLIFRGDRTESCPNVRGAIYNPRKLSPDAVPEPGQGSADQYAVGDLSGKYGPLQNKEKHFQQVYDPAITLFGPHSIVGRSAVVYHTDGQPLACANVERVGRRLVTAFATFDYPLQGQLIMRQDRDDPFADTSIYLELSYPSGTHAEKTRHHAWRVHERPLATGARFSVSGFECYQAGAVYNPRNASVDASYWAHCGEEAPGRCREGDLSAKLRTLDIPPFAVKGGRQSLARYFFSDPTLSVGGVVGRSVMVYAPDYSEDPLACANVFEHLSSEIGAR